MIISQLELGPPVDKRTDAHGRVQYLVRWRGYGKKYDSPRTLLQFLRLNNYNLQYVCEELKSISLNWGSNSSNSATIVFLNNTKDAFVSYTFKTFSNFIMKISPFQQFTDISNIIDSSGNSSLQVGYFPRSGFGLSADLLRSIKQTRKKAYYFASLLSLISDDWVLLVVVLCFSICI